MDSEKGAALILVLTIAAAYVLPSISAVVKTYRGLATPDERWPRVRKVVAVDRDQAYRGGNILEESLDAAPRDLRVAATLSTALGLASRPIAVLTILGDLVTLVREGAPTLWSPSVLLGLPGSILGWRVYLTGRSIRRDGDRAAKSAARIAAWTWGYQAPVVLWTAGGLLGVATLGRVPEPGWSAWHWAFFGSCAPLTLAWAAISCWNAYALGQFVRGARAREAALAAAKVLAPT